ncbi:MAG: hypothetical protein Kow0022_15200 [Phycisphaerales bacterium]
MSGTNHNFRFTSLIIALVAGTAAGLALGQATHPQNGAQAGRAERLRVVQNGHPQLFKVSAADAPRSPATLVYADSGYEMPGYVLVNRVLVRGRMKDVTGVVNAALPAVVRNAPSIEPSSDVPGWVIVETATVREAIEIAEALRASGRFDAISVDTEDVRESRSLPSDPLVSDQWYLENTTRTGDLNVSAVYDLGITGRGVTVGILEAGDDNFQVDHPDLAANWAESLSMATTPFWTIDTQEHPTNVAGIIAAVADNDIGIAGVAYDAKLARLRNGTKLVRARAVQWFYNSIQIQSNSWGPANPPGLIPAHTEDEFVMDALERATRVGRGGKGVIYLFASGNDGPADRVDYEPLASNRRTIAVGAVDENMDIAGYSQGGTSLFVTAYSGPADPSPPGIRNITTTAANSDFTADFSGTSAACPMAAGVVALMLQANPSLTYRDVQHILAETSIPANFENDGIYVFAGGVPGIGNTWWQVNGAFKRHSDEYGFGVIDAEAAVNAALTWTGAGDLRFLDTYDIVPDDGEIPAAEFVEFPPESGEYVISTWLNYPSSSFQDTFCVKTDIQLEAVEVELTTSGPWVGGLQILLTSPYGTVSPLALTRLDPGTYTNYVFTTFKHWGEPSAGEWTIQITDFIPDGPFDVEGATVDLSPYGLDGIDGASQKTVTQYRVRFYGTDFAGAEPYLCDPNNQGCPGDLNGDGIVSPEDLIFFLNLYTQGDPFADINGDGIVTWDDLIAFFNMFTPGFCPSPDNDGPGGRPMPGGSDNGQPVGAGGNG